jgi:methylamine utilization protein MauE
MAAGEIALRTVLAVVFAVAFVSKVRSRAAFGRFARTLDGFGLLRGRRRTAAALVVPAAEAALLVLLGLPGTALAGFAAALTVLAVFTGAVGWELAAGRTVRCRCFGGGAERIGATQIVRNLVLLGCAAAGVVLSVTSRGDASAWALVLAVGGALLAAAFIVRWDDLATLARASW